MKMDLKKYRNRIIAAVVIVVALSVAWLRGGGFSVPISVPAPVPVSAPAPAPVSIPVPAPLVGAEASALATSPPETGEDQFGTNPVPSGQPLPVEPQDAAVGDGSFTVTFSVRCDAMLENKNLLDKEKRDLIPVDGIIFPATQVTAYEGESVFNVLQREMKRAQIHLEFVNTPIYNSAYIEGINNLYEFDAGELSGWTYKVNDWYPNYGCSRYQLAAGDVVEWQYTDDRSLGEYGNGGQRDE